MATTVPTSTTAPAIPAPAVTAIAKMAPGSPQRPNAGSLPTEIHANPPPGRNRWRAVVESTNLSPLFRPTLAKWPSVPVPDDAPGVSLFPLVHRAFQLHCGTCNEPRLPNTLMPYGANPFELVCRRCRFDQMLRALRTKDRATLAALLATPFTECSEVTCFGTETVQYLGLPARALRKMPFDTVDDKNTKWAVYPVHTVQLVYYACTGSMEPMSRSRPKVQ
ncbi:hypothetical protein AMAG_03490 [Allomyces macrogynus ATCC 38327]|uniref:Uncharacterized protein n=1 Tax=Allomyces macrogynus (strain ATCC 38327) TaxID=578462 RepID=A0A0L0S9V0_ALLM3|nr:hypothetical protein AMAG_03490 [Allomyces macrogynus ATCC 38327]|eukprot:KNE59164.1 hypothetical protein AMAG_03490 [Allomyces macrogynus ATCC 38327]